MLFVCAGIASGLCEVVQSFSILFAWHGRQVFVGRKYKCAHFSLTQIRLGITLGMILCKLPLHQVLELYMCLNVFILTSKKKLVQYIKWQCLY